MDGIRVLTPPDLDLDKIGPLDEIRAMGTCTVSNAIERLNVRLRNEGFISGTMRCRFPNLQPMLGYAVTVATIPAPRVIVLQDIDHMPGVGAFVGEIHAAIGMALKCVGYVTNGAVRDLAAVKALGFDLFSGSVSVSHAYAHLIEFGDPVEIGGLKITPGDLLHGDRHGVLKIRAEAVAGIPREAERLMRAESELIRFCQSPQFSLKGLSNQLKQISKVGP
jgi:4-hydroxy-4-methyl-2-oxoglutarate aldolase